MEVGMDKPGRCGKVRGFEKRVFCCGVTSLPHVSSVSHGEKAICLQRTVMEKLLVNTTLQH